MKNYRMFLIGGKSRDMTAEIAAKIVVLWKRDAARIVVDDEIFATHQICSIEKIKGQELKDLKDKFSFASTPVISDFLSDKKLLQ